MGLHQGSSYAKVSSESLTREQCTSKDTWVLPGFSFLQVVGLSQFLAGCLPVSIWESLQGSSQHGHCLPQSQHGRESLPVRQKLWSHEIIEVTSPWGWRIQLATSSYSRSGGWYSSAMNTKRQGSWGPSAGTATQKKFTLPQNHPSNSWK